MQQSHFFRATRQPHSARCCRALSYEPHPETLQILKGMPRPQIMQEMRKIAAALGVECNFCHINPFEAATPRKAVARLMMRDYTMAMKHKDGSALSCNDYHQGHARPLTILPFPKRPERRPEPQPAKKPNGPNFLE